MQELSLIHISGSEKYKAQKRAGKMIRLRYWSNPIPQIHTGNLTVEKVTISSYNMLKSCLLYTSTMDKENSAVRKYIAQRADLLGAIRLPNNTFKVNAGTEVVSDILILQKRCV